MINKLVELFLSIQLTETKIIYNILNSCYL